MALTVLAVATLAQAQQRARAIGGTSGVKDRRPAASAKITPGRVELRRLPSAVQQRSLLGTTPAGTLRPLTLQSSTALRDLSRPQTTTATRSMLSLRDMLEASEARRQATEPKVATPTYGPLLAREPGSTAPAIGSGLGLRPAYVSPTFAAQEARKVGRLEDFYYQRLNRRIQPPPPWRPVTEYMYSQIPHRDEFGRVQPRPTARRVDLSK
jgi:hypothetical protein